MARVEKISATTDEHRYTGMKGRTE